MLFFWRVRMEGLPSWFSKVMYIINRKQKDAVIFSTKNIQIILPDSFNSRPKNFNGNLEVQIKAGSTSF